MTFTLLPAVDVAGGRVARGGSTVAVAGPRTAVAALQAAGAAWIHLVDLDAAYGRGSNAALLAAVIGELDVPVQLSAGVHDDASLAWALSTGCACVVVGTAALADPAWVARAAAAHGDRVVVALDVRVEAQVAGGGTTAHRLAPRGRGGDVGDLWTALAHLDRAGCARYVVTDVDRDGTLLGPNTDLYRAVGERTATPVVASGGIATLDDLATLAGLAATGTHVEGAVVGRALAAGRFTLAEALAAVRTTGGSSSILRA